MSVSVEENKTAVRRFVEEVQDHHNLAVVDEVFASNYLDHAVVGGDPSFRGVEGFKRLFGLMLAAFPDLRVTINEMIAEEDKVVTRKTLQGTHSGVFQGIPATGKHVELEVIDIFRVADGKLAEHWVQVDTLSILRQIGAVPAPGPGK